jgi:hypothetical protein
MLLTLFLTFIPKKNKRRKENPLKIILGLGDGEKTASNCKF